MDVWTIKGVEEFSNDMGEACVRLYVERPLVLTDGHTGAGVETQRLFYKHKYVKYAPRLNDQIVAVSGRYGIAQILVVGHVDAA